MSRQKRIRKARAAKKRERRRMSLIRELQRRPILERSFVPFYVEIEWETKGSS
jgi:hypothetical protein